MHGIRHTIRHGLTAAVAAAALVGLSACGSSGGLPTTSSSVTPSPTTAATIAPPTATSTSAPSATAAAVTVTVSVADGSVLARVTAADGRAAAGAVAFTVDGAAAGSASVAGDTATVPLPAGLAVGDHAIAAAFTPADATVVAAAQGTATYGVAKAPSTVTAGTAKETIRYGDQAAFTVTVTAPGATDLSGHVAVLDGETVVADGDTDASGHAALDVYNTADPGARTYTARYDGNGSVAPSTAQFTVTTTQTDVDIVISFTDKPAPGSDVTVTADVVGTPQSPGGTATITVDGTQIAAGPVNEKGIITGTVAAVTAGDHTVTVSYAGDVRFEPDTASATLTVTEPVANPNAAGAAAAQASNPCPASASACVDLANTQAWLQSGGQITYGPVPITSGAAGSRTRTGTFSVFWKDKNHKSSLFNNAPMPNSVFFDGDIAFHQGSLYDQSNGCIHLSWDASATFFSTLSVGDSVYVWGAPPY
ncbi:Ig-like domain repeat protein [Nakamurella sp.]|uniref:Ig-like domain repeat protein n=1 Tax=Nakamurella sp. TaxID=1869182 RepID=UPI003B3B23D1